MLEYSILVIGHSAKLTTKYTARLSEKKEEAMKKYQYTISIAVGVLMGAIIALLIGNTITAILGGVIGAGLTAWVGSLQWSKAKYLAIGVADWMDLPVHLKNTIDSLRAIPARIYKTTRWSLWAIKRLTIAPVISVSARKCLVAGFFLLSLVIADSMLVRHLNSVSAGSYLSISLVLIMISAIIVSLVAVSMIWGFFMVKALGDHLGSEINVNKKICDPSLPVNLSLDFLVGWADSLEDDVNSGALTALARMLYIRTGNALKILAYPFVLVIWGIMALANNKTGASALSAMTLSGAHLAIAHIAGGIDTANANFWLSLIVAMGLGVMMGRKIHKMRESANTHHPLPSIKFRSQVELHRS